MPPTPPSPAPRHLLVVDDEPPIGLLLRPQLEASGYRVCLARSLAEGRAAPVDDPAFRTPEDES